MSGRSNNLRRNFVTGANRPRARSTESVLPPIHVKYDVYPVNETVKPKPPRKYPHVHSKLTEQQVLEMRAQFALGCPWPWGGIGGQSFCQHYAAIYDVTPSVIRAAVIDQTTFVHI